MRITLSDNYRLPDGQPLADQVAALFALQRREIIDYVRSGRVTPINLNGWIDYSTDKLLPFYLWHVAQGWKMQGARLQAALPKQKSSWRGLFKASDVAGRREQDKRDRRWLLALLGLFDDDIVADVRRMVRQVVESILATTAKWVNAALQRFRDALNAGEEPVRGALVHEIDAIMRRPDRPISIGDTESSRAFHFGMVRVLQESRYRWFKTWRTAEDEKVCPVCRPLNGVTLPLNQTFASLPESGTYAGIYTLLNAPPAHPGTCRCKLEMTVEIEPAQYVPQREMVEASAIL